MVHRIEASDFDGTLIRHNVSNTLLEINSELIIFYKFIKFLKCCVLLQFYSKTGWTWPKNYMQKNQDNFSPMFGNHNTQPFLHIPPRSSSKEEAVDDIFGLLFNYR